MEVCNFFFSRCDFLLFDRLYSDFKRKREIFNKHYESILHVLPRFFNQYENLKTQIGSSFLMISLAAKTAKYFRACSGIPEQALSPKNQITENRLDTNFRM